VRQVEVFIEHPPENSMIFFDFTSTALDEGTTFIFGSWVCVPDGAGSFCLFNDTRMEASAASQHSGLDKFIDDLDETLLSNVAREIEEEDVFNMISTRAAPGLLRSDLIRPEDLCTRLPFGLRNTATV
jgi:hypothetical protein